MQQNSINNTEIINSCNSIETSTNNVINNLNKVTQLMEMLSSNFSDNSSVNLCESICTEKIVILKKYCEKCLQMKNLLQKMSNAYDFVDKKFSTKQIIE